METVVVVEESKAIHTLKRRTQRMRELAEAFSQYSGQLSPMQHTETDVIWHLVSWGKVIWQVTFLSERSYAITRV